MTRMSKEQIAARELISLYEGGSKLTCEFDGYVLTLESDTGVTYWVDREGKHIRRTDGHPMDLVEIEARLETPENFGPGDPDYYWPPDEQPPPPIRMATDLDWERVHDLETQRQQDRELEDYWYRRERGYRH